MSDDLHRRLPGPLAGTTPVDEDGGGDAWDVSWQLRSSLLWMSVPVPLALLVVPVALSTVSFASLTGRPHWLIPSPPARWTAAVAAVLAVAEAPSSRSCSPEPVPPPETAPGALVCC